MVSPTARSAYDEMRTKGLTPSFDDIVRINALGLKLEGARAKDQVNSTWHLPRVARINERLAFRQPTVGHEIWFERVMRFCEFGDFQTALAVKAYALARPACELPDPDSPESVRTAVDAFAKECADLCRDQIYAAIRYVTYGCDPRDGEHAPKRGSAAEPDWDECVALGVLNEGRAILWGLSAADMTSMTVRQLNDVITRAYFVHNLKTDGEADRLTGEFYAAVDEIESRLKAGKESGNG